MISRVGAIQRQVIFPAVLNREDLPVALPLVRLHAQVGRTETGKLCHFSRWQKIAAIQNGRLGLNEHAGLLARSLRRSDIGQQNIDHLLQGSLPDAHPSAVCFGRNLYAAVLG
jgi:hypothetical protein